MQTTEGIASHYKSGDRYGFLTLIGKCYRRGTLRYVECICDCGKIWFTLLTKIKKGGTKSCGCQRVNFIIKGNTTHGLASNGTKHPIYRAWHQIQERCRGNTEDNLKSYKKRGIVVCEEWVSSFDLFYKWAIDNGWQKGLTLERVKNNEGYSPLNCIWATHKFNPEISGQILILLLLEKLNV